MKGSFEGLHMIGEFLIRVYLQGYCVDLAEKLREESLTPYEYRIDLVGDNNYGTVHEKLGCWDGMIGELISTQGCPNGTRKVWDVTLAQYSSR